MLSDRARSGLRVATAVVAVVLLSWSAAEADDTVRWRVSHAAGGVHRVDGVIPVVVRMQNDGPRDRRLVSRASAPNARAFAASRRNNCLNPPGMLVASG